MQRKKREVLARRKYALLPSSSSSSENDLSSESSSSSSTEGEEDLFVSPGENHQNNTAVPSGKFNCYGTSVAELSSHTVYFAFFFLQVHWSSWFVFL